MSQITAVLCGAGGRGHFAYGPYARQFPDQLRFVAVAEPDPARRKRFAEAHNIPLDRQFTGWEQLFAAGKLAETCFNMTQDQDHHASTQAKMQLRFMIILRVHASKYRFPPPRVDMAAAIRALSNRSFVLYAVKRHRSPMHANRLRVISWPSQRKNPVPAEPLFVWKNIASARKLHNQRGHLNALDNT